MIRKKLLHNIFKSAVLLLLLVSGTPLRAQDNSTDPVAENMLVYQRSYGGWPKAIGNIKVDYSRPISDEQRKEIRATTDNDDATIDNKATSREIVYLMKAYGQTKNQRYLQAAKEGIDYILKAQYENGGWPQYYPNKKIYRAQITYNDDAMINVLNILFDVANKSGDYAVLDETYVAKAQKAVDKGIDCILKTQVVINGKRTAWGAQYDEKKLVPAKARAFELPSLASSESASVVKFLMRIKQPSAEVKDAIQGAVTWFDQVKITGYRTDRIDAPSEEKGKDVVLVADPSSTIWARFYDLQTMQPQFVGRDSVPKTKLADIDNERRVGYAWYGNWGEKVAKEYPKWKKANGIE